MDDRYQREQSFHDHAYAEHTRAAAGKFYAIQGSSRERYRRFIEANGGTGARVLEYGCGRGSSAFELARSGASVTAIDISEAGLDMAREEARSRGLTVEFRMMNAEALEFADTTFDLVCGTAILHHLDLDRSFQEIARVLKPTGVGGFIEPLGHNPLINLYRKLTPKMRTVDEHPLRVEDFDIAKRHFDRVEIGYYHLFSLAELQEYSNAGTAASRTHTAKFLGRHMPCG